MMGASGELISTPTDLNRFFAALLRGRLVPPRLLAEMTRPGVDGATYGLGMFLKETTCGVPIYGNDGDALSYQAWSYSTADARRQVTIAVTPDFRADLDNTIDDYLDQVFCT